MRLAPRWPAADVNRVKARCEYAASGEGFGYRYTLGDSSLGLELSARGSEVDAHILLPRSARTVSAQIEGQDVPFRESQVQESFYTDLNFRVEGRLNLMIKLRNP